MKRIMVVDDDQDILDSIEMVMKMRGYKVVTAKNGEGCLKRLEGGGVDLILLDIMMPGITAKYIIEEINKNEQLKGIKIIYLTAVSMSEGERKEMMKLRHVVGFIEKPFDTDDLLKRVGKALRK